MKRQSDSRTVEARQMGVGESSSTGKGDKPRRSRLRVNITRWHGVAYWSWNAGDGEVCGICQGSFEGCSPGVKYPGDESPVVWGKCGHAFHLQCVSTWLASNSTCPFCRSEWEFKADDPVDESRIS